jgi:outer membrane protein
MSALLIAALLAAAPQAPSDASASAAPSANAVPITLEAVRREGRTNTQALLALLEVATAEQDSRLARSALLPQVDLSLSGGLGYSGASRTTTYVADEATGIFVPVTVEAPSATNRNYNFSLNLTQVIYDRARWKQLAQSGAVVEAQRGQASDQTDASELEAINRFFTLYRSQATLQVLEATVRRSEQQLERAQALFQAGRVGRGEELTARVNLGNDRIALLLRRGQLVQDQTQLAIWLARPGTEPLVAQDPGILNLDMGSVPALEESLAVARGRRPLVRALQEQVRAAQLARDVATSGYFPRVLSQGSYSRQGSSTRQELPDGSIGTRPILQNGVSGAVVLQWDLFSGFGTRAQVSRAEASVRTAELNLARVERELDGAVRLSIEALAANIEATRLAAANREVAQQSLALAEERFKAGAGSTLEVRDAQLSLTRAELTLLENRVDVEIARFSLMRAMGTLSSGELK